MQISTNMSEDNDMVEPVNVANMTIIVDDSDEEEEEESSVVQFEG